MGGFIYEEYELGDEVLWCIQDSKGELVAECPTEEWARLLTERLNVLSEPEPEPKAPKNWTSLDVFSKPPNDAEITDQIMWELFHKQAPESALKPLKPGPSPEYPISPTEVLEQLLGPPVLAKGYGIYPNTWWDEQGVTWLLMDEGLYRTLHKPFWWLYRQYGRWEIYDALARNPAVYADVPTSKGWGTKELAAEKAWHLRGDFP